MKISLQPTKELAAVLAPKKTLELSTNIKISSKATKQSRLAKSDLEIFVGPVKEMHYAVEQEFGTIHHGANPFMRPAWDATKYSVLTRFGYIQWEEIEKAIERARRKAEREARKMGAL